MNNGMVDCSLCFPFIADPAGKVSTPLEFQLLALCLQRILLSGLLALNWLCLQNVLNLFTVQQGDAGTRAPSPQPSDGHKSSPLPGPGPGTVLVPQSQKKLGGAPGEWKAGGGGDRDGSEGAAA